MLTLEMPASKKTVPTPAEFVALLRAWIERHSLSQREAAGRLMIPLPTLESWLRGIRNPSPMAIRALLPDLNR